MKLMNGLTLSLFLAASPMAFGETVKYHGSLNGSSVTVQFLFTENSALAARYVPCQTLDDQPCSGPGTYAFFYQSGTVTLAYSSQLETAPINLAFYSGAEKIQKGQLNGSFGFTDNTGLPTSEGDYGRAPGYQFSLTQYGANPIQVSVSANQATGLKFPSTYQLNWTIENAKSPRGYDGGTITLTQE